MKGDFANSYISQPDVDPYYKLYLGMIEQAAKDIDSMTDYYSAVDFLKHSEIGRYILDKKGVDYARLRKVDDSKRTETRKQKVEKPREEQSNRGKSFVSILKTGSF